MNTLTELFAAIHAAVAANWPGRVPVRIDIHLHDAQQPISLPIPAASRPSVSPEAAFVPNVFQKGILAALDGKALHKDPLGAKVGDCRRLYRHPGGLRELREHGLVKLHPRLGYYRPDAPPPDLASA